MRSIAAIFDESNCEFAVPNQNHTEFIEIIELEAWPHVEAHAALEFKLVTPFSESCPYTMEVDYDIPYFSLRWRYGYETITFLTHDDVTA